MVDAALGVQSSPCSGLTYQLGLTYSPSNFMWTAATNGPTCLIATNTEYVEDIFSTNGTDVFTVNGVLLGLETPSAPAGAVQTAPAETVVNFQIVMMLNATGDIMVLDGSGAVLYNAPTEPGWSIEGTWHCDPSNVVCGGSGGSPLKGSFTAYQ